MAETAWSEPALADLDAIADFIAQDNPTAAADLVRKVLPHIEHLREHPESGPRPAELKGWRYRQIVEPPCRVFYRYERSTVFVVHVMRAERKLRRTRLKRQESSNKARIEAVWSVAANARRSASTDRVASLPVLHVAQVDHNAQESR